MAGSFEKLGILVIVVIIVMILTVAIYQWGGAAGEPVVGSTPAAETIQEPLFVEIDKIPPVVPAPIDGGTPASPSRYVVQKGDNIWTLVVKKWGLKESFIAEIQKANPGKKIQDLQVGDTLIIPDTAAFLVKPRTPAASDAKDAKGRPYVVQPGDTLRSIAREHLGSPDRAKEIQQLNGGLTDKALKAGHQILLPLK